MIVCEQVDHATGRVCPDPAQWRVYSTDIGDGADVCSGHIFYNLDYDETNHVIRLDPCEHDFHPATDCAVCRDPFVQQERP